MALGEEVDELKRERNRQCWPVEARYRGKRTSCEP
jgi:hypothetical protein